MKGFISYFMWPFFTGMWLVDFSSNNSNPVFSWVGIPETHHWIPYLAMTAFGVWICVDEYRKKYS